MQLSDEKDMETREDSSSEENVNQKAKTSSVQLTKKEDCFMLMNKAENIPERLSFATPGPSTSCYKCVLYIQYMYCHAYVLTFYFPLYIVLTSV